MGMRTLCSLNISQKEMTADIFSSTTGIIQADSHIQRYTFHSRREANSASNVGRYCIAGGTSRGRGSSRGGQTLRVASAVSGADSTFDLETTTSSLRTSSATGGMLVRPESASDSRRRVKHVVTVVRYDEGGGGGGGGVGVGGETCKELDVDAVTVESTKVAVARTAKDDVMWKQADDKSKCKETFL